MLSRRVAASAVVLLALVGCAGERVQPPEDDVALTVAPERVPAAPQTSSPTTGAKPANAQPRAAAEPPAPPATRQALERHLAGLVAAATDVITEAQLAVLVVDEFGREVVAYEADRPMLPASTLKLVTAAAVLTTIGPDGRLSTAVHATAGIGGDGVLDGDLVLTGAGDPTLVTAEYASYVYPARPHTLLDELADALVAAGLERVMGQVRGAAPGFSGAPLPTGWRDTYLSDLDGRHIAGLTVDGGLRTLLEYPEIDDEELLADATLMDAPLEPSTVRVEHAQDPAAHTAAEFTRLLTERGVEVEGEPAVGMPDAPLVGRLASVSSPSMLDLLRFMNEHSDNHLADQLFHIIGRTRTGEGSWSRGERALRQVLARFDVAHDGARFADGSGLSRDDRLTARLLVELDLALTSAPRWSKAWTSIQAVAGQTGTLRMRLRGTPAEGRFIGKTGSLRDVTTVAGQVIDRDRGADTAPRFHLAVLANDAVGTDRQVARALMDEIVLALVAELDGCALLPVDSPLGIPQSLVAC